MNSLTISIASLIMLGSAVCCDYITKSKITLNYLFYKLFFISRANSHRKTEITENYCFSRTNVRPNNSIYFQITRGLGYKVEKGDKGQIGEIGNKGLAITTGGKRHFGRKSFSIFTAWKQSIKFPKKLGVQNTHKNNVAMVRNKIKVIKDITALQTVNIYKTLEALHSLLLVKLNDFKYKLLIKTIKVSVNYVFSDDDLVRFWGEMVHAKQTLTNRWVDDVKNIKGINRQLNFAFSRYSEALYFKNKKSTILAAENTETKIQLFNATR